MVCSSSMKQVQPSQHVYSTYIHAYIHLYVYIKELGAKDVEKFSAFYLRECTKSSLLQKSAKFNRFCTKGTKNFHNFDLKILPSH